uniref:Uncharacterized protein n=1 Tax=Pyramimonas obovata TaxID=1411642 RepID=A0A7S0R4Z2_9CHLO|mmetsp:Transcript_25841/g.56098  ORF Transcript_25841/g.56098 Transcript_25841/m.56098 type:complete len:134 (+) Transcript_25841:1-402(+)
MPQMPQMPALPQFEFEMPALPQCLSELLRGPTGLPGLLLLLLRQFLVFVAAVLVYTELFWNTLAWGTLATAAIVLPGWSPHSMYSRFHTYLGAATSPELAMYSTPLLGRFVSLHKQDLEDLSLMFRVLSFLLV